MLFCNNCGQSVHISDDNFYENRNTSGWERAYIDPNDGEIVDYGDSETTDSDHESYECPYCGSENIEFDSDASADYAEELRRGFDRMQEDARVRRAAEREQIEFERKAKDPSRQWDVEVNV